MRRNNRLFLDTFVDLQDRTERGNQYDLIRASALLRQLLLDGLLDIANRPYKFKLQYKILDHQEIDKHLPAFPHSDDWPRIETAVVVMYWKNIDPLPVYSATKSITLTPDEFLRRLHDIEAYIQELPLRVENVIDAVTGNGETRTYLYNILRETKNAPTITLKLPSFLKTKCILFEGQEYSVKDIIKSAANSRGGVHQDDKITEKNENLLNLDDLMNIAGTEASIIMLQGINNVVLKAIEPLYKKILESG